MAARGIDPVDIIGINAAGAAMSSSGLKPMELIVRKGSLSPRLKILVETAGEQGLPVRFADTAYLDRIAGGTVHQGVVLRIREWPYLDEAEMTAKIARACDPEGMIPPPFLLLLDHIQDVGNLGAIIRSAYLCGVTGIVMPKTRAAPVTSAVVRSSAGTAALVDIFRVANLNGIIRKIKEAGLWVFGLEGECGESILDIDLTPPLALVLGGEHQGLSPLVRKNCDMLISIPMADRSFSYNASVAAAIVMFEAMRQRIGCPSRQ